MADPKRKTTVQSLQRGLEILVAVAQANRALGITELSRQFGLAKGSISRLVATLAQQSFLTRDPETAKYRLSTRIWELGIGALSQLDVRGVARPAMEALNAATRETVHLTVLTESDEMVFLDKLDSTRAVRPNIELGTTLPAYCVANGKAMLAFLPKARVDRALRGKLRQFTNTTISRKSELLAHLDSVRRLGYAVNRGEYRADVSGLAAPICDHTGLAVAALGVSLPSNRMTADWIRDLAPRVMASARQVSAALGQRPGSGAQLSRRTRPSSAGRVAPQDQLMRVRGINDTRSL
ncbi:MAG: IclR family transcriptional regulator [Betaproteobacteria bacterium]|nr:IclR family transcriptional regulator [Betaproteobacteria bacterium]